MTCFDNPKVSVCIPTYYHEKYIKEAIDSVLKQHVSFEYEIVVSDDCSFDRTQSIILSYANKYDNIRYYFHEKNIGLTNNIYFARSKCKGKYIIGLSGDDYWIDNNKMQKQYDFLEKNNEYIAVSTRIYSRKDEDTKNISCIPDIKLCNINFTLDMFLSGLNFPENGMMMRNPFLNNHIKDEYDLLPKISKYIDDITNNFILLKNGSAYILDDVTAVYRSISKSKEAKNFNSINNQFSIFIKTIENLNNIEEHYKDKYDLTNRYKYIMKTGISGIMHSHKVSIFYNSYLSIPKKYRRKHLIIHGIFSLISSFVNERLIKKEKKI